MTWKYILIFIDRRWSSSVEHHHPRPTLTPHSSHPPHVALGVIFSPKQLAHNYLCFPRNSSRGGGARNRETTVPVRVRLHKSVMELLAAMWAQIYHFPKTN